MCCIGRAQALEWCSDQTDVTEPLSMTKLRKTYAKVYNSAFKGTNEGTNTGQFIQAGGQVCVTHISADITHNMFVILHPQSLVSGHSSHHALLALKYKTRCYANCTVSQSVSHTSHPLHCVDLFAWYLPCSPTCTCVYYLCGWPCIVFIVYCLYCTSSEQTATEELYNLRLHCQYWFWMHSIILELAMVTCYTSHHISYPSAFGYWG